MVHINGLGVWRNQSFNMGGHHGGAQDIQHKQRMCDICDKT